MYLKMIDTSIICDINIECGNVKNNSVLFYIPNDLIENLSQSFIQKYGI